MVGESIDEKGDVRLKKIIIHRPAPKFDQATEMNN